MVMVGSAWQTVGRWLEGGLRRLKAVGGGRKVVGSWSEVGGKVVGRWKVVGR